VSNVSVLSIRRGGAAQQLIRTRGLNSLRPVVVGQLAAECSKPGTGDSTRYPPWSLPVSTATRGGAGNHGMRPINLYNPGPVACRPYDPRAPLVASRLREMIRGRAPAVEVEHVGSTSVPGCEGKGYIDLLVLYPEGALEAAKDALAALGFQPQTSRDPFPEERPMRVGSFTFDGREYPIHAHVVYRDSAEAVELIWFRERLRSDARLREQYVAEKRRILAAGVTDQLDYCVSKGAFVERTLAARESA